MNTRFNIILEARRDPLKRAPVVVLRQALELLWRAFGLKCLSCTEQPMTLTEDDSQRGASRS